MKEWDTLEFLIILLTDWGFPSSQILWRLVNVWEIAETLPQLCRGRACGCFPEKLKSNFNETLYNYW